MTRLSLSKTIALLCFLLISQTTLATESTCRCTPKQACWPDNKVWGELKKQLSGQLGKPMAEIETCIKDSQTKACAQALKNIHNPYLIENNPGDTQSQGMLNAWMNHTSTYAVEAENSQDVAAAVNFAREHHLRVVIKGTGHDYLGRSNAADSLLIWTHKMRDITFDKAFIPTGCEDKQSVQALTVGAGTRWLEAYHVATNQNNRYVQGGGCATVGAAGGFTQGGGFGSFSKNFGTGAAGIVQAEIVTADGKTLIANRCQNQDLFWAIKGGGGSTFGIVTQLTLKTHPMPKTFGVYKATIKAANDQAFKELIAEFISFYRGNLNNDHWGEQISFNSDNSLSLFLTFKDLSDTQAKYTFSPLRNWLNKNKGAYILDESITTLPANKMWDEAFLLKTMPSLIIVNKDAGNNNQFWWTPNSREVSNYWYTYQSWWLPIHFFEDNQKAKLADVIFKSSRLTSTTLHINKGLSGAPDSVKKEVGKTATNPAVLEAAALVIMAAGNNQVYPDIKGKEPDYNKAKNSVDNISKAISLFKQLAPTAGSYVNETDYFLKDWQQALWGDNYAKLLRIKKQYDPEGLFYCHHCVGSESWTDDGMCRAEASHKDT